MPEKLTNADIVSLILEEDMNNIMENEEIEQIISRLDSLERNR